MLNINDRVIVPEPLQGDNWSKSFEGTIIAIGPTLVQVLCKNKNKIFVKPNRLTLVDLPHLFHLIAFEPGDGTRYLVSRPILISDPTSLELLGCPSQHSKTYLFFFGTESMAHARILSASPFLSPGATHQLFGFYNRWSSYACHLAFMHLTDAPERGDLDQDVLDVLNRWDSHPVSDLQPLTWRQQLDQLR